MTRTTRPLPALLAAALAALALAACGGGDGGSDAASSASEEQDKKIAFADCLRENGVYVEFDAEGGMMTRSREVAPARGASSGGTGIGGSRDTFDDCRKQTGWSPPEPSEEDRAEMRDRALAFARCMREHGVDVPDPKADGEMTLRMDGGSGVALERAARACDGEGGPAAAPAAPAP